MERNYKNWPLWEKLFFPGFLVLMAVLSILSGGSWLSLAAGLFCFIGAMLNTKARADSFLYNGIGSILYGIIALISHNYGEMLLSLAYNTPSYAMALYRWKKSGSGGTTNEVFHLDKKLLVIFCAALPVVSIIYWLILRSVGSANPLFNAIATCASILAVYLAAHRCCEQWWFWTLYNLSLVIIWFPRNGDLAYMATFLTGIGYLVLSTTNWIKWTKLANSLKQ